LERCPSDPARFKAHPATLLEIAFLKLSKEDFNAIQPEHTKTIKPNQPLATGIAWIDEMEERLFLKDS
jgi:hypothetical protein